MMDSGSGSSEMNELGFLACDAKVCIVFVMSLLSSF